MSLTRKFVKHSGRHDHHDIIVGFPTQTQADFAETLRVDEASRFPGARVATHTGRGVEVRARQLLKQQQGLPTWPVFATLVSMTSTRGTRDHR